MPQVVLGVAHESDTASAALQVRSYSDHRQVVRAVRCFLRPVLQHGRQAVPVLGVLHEAGRAVIATLQCSFGEETRLVLAEHACGHDEGDNGGAVRRSVRTQAVSRGQGDPRGPSPACTPCRGLFCCRNNHAGTGSSWLRRIHYRRRLTTERTRPCAAGASKLTGTHSWSDIAAAAVTGAYGRPLIAGTAHTVPTAEPE